MVAQADAMPRVSSVAAVKVGELLHAARETAGYSQRDLDELTGIDTSNISKYERGIALPNLGSLIRLASALGVSPAALIEGVSVADLPEDVDRKRRPGVKAGG